MKLLNFKFMKKRGGNETVITRQQRKADARAARARRVKRRMEGNTFVPFMGSAADAVTGTTRQARRRKAFMAAFDDITRRFSGEPRKVRRAMARDLAKRTLGAK